MSFHRILVALTAFLFVLWMDYAARERETTELELRG